MEQDDLRPPPYQVTTDRDGEPVIVGTVATELAARARFESAVELCKTRDDAHSHRVVPQHGPGQLRA
ncbi:hypothetical protein MOX02_17290 [Methylobacterium oxalidis]|uniref:Uncharacterized protein n=1 Tax=Methylobacterium oxalidis TaxID=944322 RepID=A0A512J138_9HYPH|nr:hypothetical protein MOX02_17290 [Methylobacterium oxalidis]